MSTCYVSTTTLRWVPGGIPAPVAPSPGIFDGTTDDGSWWDGKYDVGEMSAGSWSMTTAPTFSGIDAASLTAACGVCFDTTSSTAAAVTPMFWHGSKSSNLASFTAEAMGSYEAP